MGLEPSPVESGKGQEQEQIKIDIKTGGCQQQRARALNLIDVPSSLSTSTRLAPPCHVHGTEPLPLGSLTFTSAGCRARAIGRLIDPGGEKHPAQLVDVYCTVQAHDHDRRRDVPAKPYLATHNSGTESILHELLGWRCCAGGPGLITDSRGRCSLALQAAPLYCTVQTRPRETFETPVTRVVRGTARQRGRALPG